MSKINTIIMLSHGDKGATLEALKEAFKSDITIYIRGNKSALFDARQNLKNTPKDNAIGEALTCGIRAAGVAYYIAPKGVKFDAQSPDDLAMWQSHIEAGCEAFNASLDASTAWDKVVRTDEEKQKAKIKKEAKDLERVNAQVASLGLVDPKTIRPFNASEIQSVYIDEVIAGSYSMDQLQVVMQHLKDALSILKKAAKATALPVLNEPATV